MPFVGDIHYRRSKLGTQGKTPLLLIHGAGGSYLYWPIELRRLPGVDVLAVDLPGHGASPGEGSASISEYAEDIRKLLDQLQIERTVIAGHSMGGAIAMQFCLDHQDRVSGLILIGSGAVYEVNPNLIQYCEDAATFPQAVQFIEKFSFSKTADERLVQLASERLASTPASRLFTDFIACNAFDVREHLGEIDPTTLVICGAEDKMMPVSHSQLLVKNIPNARLEIIPEAGHMVMLEQPTTVASLIRDFLGEVGSSNHEPG